MTRHLNATIGALVILGCVAAQAAAPDGSRQPIDVRIVSVPVAEGNSESGLTWATWALVVGTIGGFLYAARRQSVDMGKSITAATKAAEAAQRSADLATEAARRAALDRRDALVRQTTLAIHRVAFTATSVRDLASKVPKAMTELFTLSGRAASIGEGKLPGSDTAIARKVEAEAMLANASQTLLTDWTAQSDDWIVKILVTSESHLEKLHVTKEEILRDLSDIEADKSAVRASKLAGRFKPGSV